MRPIRFPLVLYMYVLTFLLLGPIGCSKDTPLDPSGSGWTFEEIVSGSLIGVQSNLTTTSNGTVFIAYHNPLDFKLHLATRNTAGTWSHTPIDTPGWVGSGVVLLTGTDDTLHIAYRDYDTECIRYGLYDGVVWSFDYLKYVSSPSVYTQMLTNNGQLHLMELSRRGSGPSGQNSTEYWQKQASSWVHVGTSPFIGRVSPSIAFAITDSGPIAAVVNTTYHVRNDGFRIYLITTDDGGITWDKGEAAFEYDLRDDQVYARTPVSIALVIDDANEPHIIFRDPGGDLLDSVSGAIDHNVTNSHIAHCTDFLGRSWILYQKGNHFALTLYTPGSGWSVVSRISDINPNRYNGNGRWDVHVDSAGIVHISAYSRYTRSLWYGRWNGPF
ncbi:hypothetical protein ACFL39_01000 [Gemmatimonadota bacterium]